MAKGKGGFLGQDGLNAPDEPTSVEATAGDAQATVSWTNPSDTGSTAITAYHVQSNNGDGSVSPAGYDLENASDPNITLSSANDPTGIAFKPDGTKLFIGQFDADQVVEYALSTAWDVSTGSQTTTFSVLSQDTWLSGLAFKSDGTSFYISGRNTDYAYQYNMTTAWDISTASYASKSMYLASQGGQPYGIQFSSDGTKAAVINDTNTIYEYNLSTAWDISTGSYASASFDFSAQSSGARAFTYNNDGTKMFLNDYSFDKVYQYSLSTAYRPSTATYDNISYAYGALTTSTGIAFGDNGTKMYLNNFSPDGVHQYDTVAPYVTSPATVTGLTNNTSYTFKVLAKNASGWSAPSEASNSVTPSVQGQEEFTTPGTYSWTAPTGVTSVSVVVVGGGGGGMWSTYNSGTGQYGGGGGGGALRYANNVSVTPGSSYTVVVGAKGDGAPSPTDGGQSYFNSTGTVQASGGPKGSTATQTSAATGSNGTGGGSGGKGAYAAFSGGGYGGGGGAAGYSGNGGDAQYNGGPGHQSGAGGGGGGGFGSGGGVGLQGQGSNGGFSWSFGQGGSGGSNGGNYYPTNNASTSNGGAYGGGGGCQDNSSGAVNGLADGGSGAVRIIWPGGSRQFPSTNTADV